MSYGLSYHGWTSKFTFIPDIELFCPSASASPESGNWKLTSKHQPNGSENATAASGSNQSSSGNPSLSLPTISLPKGGGALRGTDEKISTNGSTGSASLGISIPTSPSRSGLHPELSLTYGSNDGNGPFGLGFTLSLPAITRKTAKGIPKYDDTNESDVFILFGFEDLVPLYKRDSLKELVKDELGNFIIDETYTDGFSVRGYAPRVQSSFTRIERWTSQSDGSIYWRNITGTNITSIYGFDENSRISDPVTGETFSWLLCQSYDDKGNAMVYTYKQEDSGNVILEQANEANRSSDGRSTNLYPKTIKYGNKQPNRDANWIPTNPHLLSPNDWMFEVVFDYGDHDPAFPTTEDRNTWPCRQDTFSTYRSGFEIRTYRLCRRILMFHHFLKELGTQDYLVSSLDIGYDENPIASMATSFTRYGYVMQKSGASAGTIDSYLRKSLPPLELEYSKAPKVERITSMALCDLDVESLANAPGGVDDTSSTWLDLDGEGLPGILTRASGGWYYKRNTSANNVININHSKETVARLASLQELVTLPATGEDVDSIHLEDLSANGRLDAVAMNGATRGFWRRTDSGSWEPFKYFDATPNISTNNPNMRLIDLTGDGLADILLTDSEAFTWFPGLGEDGYDQGRTLYQSLDEEKGPKLIFADPDQSIYLADMSGDGLTDLVRIRNSDVCYWPNNGYGRFGRKIAMDRVCPFDSDDFFHPKRVFLTDIDGSGTSDIVYFGNDGLDIYYNQSGNSLSSRLRVSSLSCLDLTFSKVSFIDLLANGTSCMVISTELPTAESRAIQYLNLMDSRKPHLLLKTVNNMGSETRIKYSPSTRFYLDDEMNGKPWQTRLAFPVQCVEQIENYDWISKNRFVTRYAYHHGFFDEVEREFRGFSMIEQWDTEELGILLGVESNLPEPTPANLDAASYIPPIYTKSWYHTGACSGTQTISRQLASEYYNMGARIELDDSVYVVDAQTTGESFREACRSLKGSLLRSEVYAADSNLESSSIPTSVTEMNYTVKLVQPGSEDHRGSPPFAIFVPHVRETMTYRCDETVEDGRLQHDMILQTDDYSNVLKWLTITYGRLDDMSKLPDERDRMAQQQLYMTYTETDVTDLVYGPYDYRLPVTSGVRSWEVTGVSPTDATDKFAISTFIDDDFALLGHAAEIAYDATADPKKQQKRLTERTKIFYRSDGFDGMLPLGQQGVRGLIAETYSLAFTSILISRIFQRKSASNAVENLVPDLPATLGSTDMGAYLDLDKNGQWWAPSGRLYFDDDPASTPIKELANAKLHFFTGRRHTDQFGNSSTIDYDTHDLLPVASKDALQNTIVTINDYRVLRPYLLTDVNGNRRQNAFDALGLVAGTAVMGKATETIGDNLDGFVADLPQDQIDQFLNLPRGPISKTLLRNATSRTVYDPLRYWRETQKLKSPDVLKPAFAASISRETHFRGAIYDTKFQVEFGYSDGSGRVIQKKLQAEPGPVGDEKMVNPRWSCSGWTMFNNKGMPVKKFEPFFDTTSDFTLANKIGVCSTLMYDSQGRVVATLHPNHSWEKVIFSPWQSIQYDVNDTSDQDDPRKDPDVGAYFKRLPDTDFMPSWVNARLNGQLGVDERSAATKALAHANTPSITHFDSMGRTFLKIADNGGLRQCVTRLVLDIQGNLLQAIDDQNRTVMRVNYDMHGRALHEASMEKGERWIIYDSGGKNLLSWDSRNHRFTSKYDKLLRVTHGFMLEGSGEDILVSQKIYGESLGDSLSTNHRGQLCQSLDQAGIVTNMAYDFKGNLLQSQRQMWDVYQTTIDISSRPGLEERTYTTFFSYDALNRPISITNPDGSKLQHTYNEAGFLDTVQTQLIDTSATVQLAWKSFIDGITYNAQGQRMTTQFGNGTLCTCTYDPNTYRLMRQELRSSTIAYQDLNYAYDAAGNVTAIRDNAQPTLYFRNTVVDALVEYTYDPMYRIISASGREHLGQIGNQPTAPKLFNEAQTGVLQPGDGNAMGRYLEQYVYDSVGNIQSVKHFSSDSQTPGWTRNYVYQEPSSLESTRWSNRLSSSSTGSSTEKYAYDQHGNMTKMPHLAMMEWGYNDQLQMTSKQVVNNGGTPEITYYVYDDAGQRVRKITERAAAAGQTPTRLKERLYIGQLFEVYHEYGSQSSTTTPAPTLTRETLHISDDRENICLVETRTVGTDQAPGQLIRYTYGNHLGSVLLELSDAAEIISYEEYFPYGSTSYQAMRNQLDVPKRYRYTMKERDEENGFYYYGARYYACWLGRWISCDPSGYTDGSNVYQYSRSNPATMSDPDGRTTIDPRALQGELQSAMDKVDRFAQHAKDFALGAKDAAVELSQGAALMSEAPMVAGVLTAKGMVDTYHEYGGGVDGVIMAANQLNPLYHAMVNGYEASEALERGDYRQVGRHSTHMAVDIAATAAIAADGVGLAEGALESTASSLPETLAEVESKTVAEVGASASKSAVAPPEPVPVAGPEPTPVAPSASVPKEALSSPVSAEGEVSTASDGVSPAPAPATGPLKGRALREARGFDVEAGSIVPLERPGQVAPEIGGGRGVTDAMRARAQYLGEKYTGPGEYDVGHVTPHDHLAPGERLRLRSENRSVNRSYGRDIAQESKRRIERGQFVRPKPPKNPNKPGGKGPKGGKKKK